jgi:hypothetical protein
MMNMDYFKDLTFKSFDGFRIARGRKLIHQILSSKGAGIMCDCTLRIRFLVKVID